MSLTAYREFVTQKAKLSKSNGFDCDPSEVHPFLKDHQKMMVCWAVQGGRRALFGAFGLGKTLVQLETIRLILQKAGSGRGLIVLPLGVRQEFVCDAAMIGLTVTFIRSIDEATAEGIYLTNYETVRDGKIDPREFTALSLDEAGVLRGFGGVKTFREFMRYFEGTSTYRFVATATPSPNDFIELLAYAAFLDIMDVSQGKTRWFKRDSTHADKLTLHVHKEHEFWLWVASWALFVQRPSDIGCSDDGYDLPPLQVVWHMIPSDHSKAVPTGSGQTRLFANAALGVVDASREKRNSTPARIAKAMEIVNGQQNATSGGSGLDSEPTVLSGKPGARESAGEGILRPEQGQDRPRGEASLPSRILQSASEAENDPRAAGSTPTEGKGTLRNGRGLPRAGEGIRAGVGPQESAQEADRSSENLWSDAAGICSDAREPGRGLCDLRSDNGTAGEQQGGAPIVGGSQSRDRDGAGDSVPSLQLRDRSVSGRPGPTAESGRVPEQIIIWCNLNDEQKTLEQELLSAGVSYSSLTGSQGIDERDTLLEAWRRGETTAFVSKPQLYGAGANLQQSHTMIFAGIGFKFSEFIQACHRIQRFGQQHPCTVHLIYTEAESEVRRVLEQKWSQHNMLVANMTAIIREHGLSAAAIAGAMARGSTVDRQEDSGEGWTLVHNDSVEETYRMETDSVGLILTSIPFSTQYEYSPSLLDFGHTDDVDHFWQQMDFLTPQLLRVLKPGRNLCVHVKDRITPSGMTDMGFQTVQPFHCDAIRHYTSHGFAYLGMRTIVTDVVRENNQTYRLGWTEQCKDGTRMGVGMPEYLLLFRKPPTDRSNGYADEPVVKAKPLCDDHGEPAPFDSRTNWKKPVPGTGYSRARWQFDAHGFWRSAGDRLLSGDELVSLPHKMLYRLWRDRSRDQVYDFDNHVQVAEELDHMQRLPASFMLLPPHSWHPDIWTDVTRMRTLNGSQWSMGKQMHLCPMQFDVADRTITQMSEPGDLVFDPFSGLGTVPLRALKLGRRGLGVELNPDYHTDAVSYLRTAERESKIPTLFDLFDTDDNDQVPEEDLLTAEVVA